MKRKLLAFVLVIAIVLGLMPGMEAKAYEWGECPSSYSSIHVFVTGNRCFWCGYNRCTHTNNRWDDKKDSSVSPVYMFENEQNHRVFSSYKRYCKDCGEYMKNVTDDGKLEGHNFTNGDTCICGYKKPVCNHNFIWEDIYDSSVLPVYQIVNEQNHRVFISYKRYCVECGEYMKNVTDDGVLKAHNFTNGDTCICGYKKPVCTHSNGNWNDVYDSSVQPVYQIENDQYHRIFNSYKRYCKDCNQYVKNVSDNGARRSHIFPNGDICICGYKKPVTGGEGQHVGVSAKIDTEYRQYSNAAAHQKRDVYGYTCSVCSETVIERYTEWIDENHKDSGQGWCLYCGAAVGAANDEAYPIITNLSVSPNAAGMSTPISVSGLVDGNGGTIARVRVSVFYNDSLTSGKVYKDYEVNSSTFDLSTVGTIVPGATLAQDGTLLIPDKGSYSLAVFATNTNGKGQGDSPALCGFTVGSCTHPNYGYDLNGKGRTVKLDDEKHLYTFPVIYYCTICGERWNGTESTEGEHSLSMKTEYEELNSAFHLVKKSLVCSAGCGMKKEVEVTTGNHTFDDAGKCTACDYIKAGNQYVVHYTFFKKNGTGSPVSASGNQINVEITDEEQYYLTIGVSCTENGEAIWRQPGTGKGIGYKFVTNSDVLSFVNDAQAKLNKAGTASVDFVDPDGEILTTFTVNVGDEYEYITGYDVGINRPTKVKVLSSALEAWGWDKNNLKDNAQARMWYRIQVFGADDFVNTEFFCEQLFANKSLVEYWDSLAEYKEDGGENDVFIDYIYGTLNVLLQQEQAAGQTRLNMASDAINSLFSSIGEGIEWLSMSEDDRKNKELAEQILKTLENKANDSNAVLQKTLNATSSIQKFEGFAVAVEYAVKPLSDEDVAKKIAEALRGANIRNAQSPKAVYDFYNSIMIELGDGKTVKSVAEILSLSEDTPQETVNAIRQMLDYLKRTGDVSEYSSELAKIAKEMDTEMLDEFLKALGDGQGTFKLDGFGFGVDSCIGLISLYNEITTKNTLYDNWYADIEEDIEQMDTDSEYYKAIQEVLNELYTYSGNDVDAALLTTLEEGAFVFADATGSAVISAFIKKASAPVALAVDGAQIILAIGNNDGKVSELSSLPESVGRFRDQRDKVVGLLKGFVTNPTKESLNEIEDEVNTLYSYIYYAQENAYRYEEEVYSALWQRHIGDHPKEGLSYYRNLVDTEMNSLRNELSNWGFSVSTIIN